MVVWSGIATSLQARNGKHKSVFVLNSGGLNCVNSNSHHTTQNEMKLIFYENRHKELFIHIRYVKFGLKMKEIWILQVGCVQWGFWLGSLH